MRAEVRVDIFDFKRPVFSNVLPGKAITLCGVVADEFLGDLLGMLLVIT